MSEYNELEYGYFAVDRIIMQRNGRYLVKWEGYPDSANSWKVKSDLTPALVEDFESERKKKKKEKKLSKTTTCSKASVKRATRQAKDRARKKKRKPKKRTPVSRSSVKVKRAAGQLNAGNLPHNPMLDEDNDGPPVLIPQAILPTWKPHNWINVEFNNLVKSMGCFSEVGVQTEAQQEITSDADFQLGDIPVNETTVENNSDFVSDYEDTNANVKLEFVSDYGPNNTELKLEFLPNIETPERAEVKFENVVDPIKTEDVFVGYPDSTTMDTNIYSRCATSPPVEISRTPPKHNIIKTNAYSRTQCDFPKGSHTDEDAESISTIVPNRNGKKYGLKHENEIKLMREFWKNIQDINRQSAFSRMASQGTNQKILQSGAANKSRHSPNLEQNLRLEMEEAFPLQQTISSTNPHSENSPASSSCNSSSNSDDSYICASSEFYIGECLHCIDQHEKAALRTESLSGSRS